MSDVSVIGCGAMGSALVETLAGQDAHVTVWNRTRERAEALAGPRVTIAESVGTAMARSPVSIMAVAGHDVASSLLERADENLRGRTVIGVSFVTPEQASRLDGRMRSVDGRYLDMEILGYPSDVRTNSAFLFLSGDRAAFDDGRSILDGLGDVRYVSATPGDAFVSGLAVLLPYLPMAVGLFQGAKVCERNDLSLEWYAEAVRTLYPRHIDDLLDAMVDDRDPTDPANVEASVRTWADGADEYADYLESEDLDAGVYRALHRLFSAGIDAGRGDHDWSYIADVVADPPDT
jgi:3-hydroxyisobutyrate dehydrogenase-like beta-hydroxyacid dehydrogenase